MSPGLDGELVHAVGDKVNYWSRRSSIWVHALVKLVNYDDSGHVVSYDLDLKPGVIPSRVRRLSDSKNPPVENGPAVESQAEATMRSLDLSEYKAVRRQEFCYGEHVKYWSETHQHWVDTYVTRVIRDPEGKTISYNLTCKDEADIRRVRKKETPADAPRPNDPETTDWKKYVYDGSDNESMTHKIQMAVQELDKRSEELKERKQILDLIEAKKQNKDGDEASSTQHIDRLKHENEALRARLAMLERMLAGSGDAAAGEGATIVNKDWNRKRDEEEKALAARALELRRKEESFKERTEKMEKLENALALKSREVLELKKGLDKREQDLQEREEDVMKREKWLQAAMSQEDVWKILEGADQQASANYAGNFADGHVDVGNKENGVVLSAAPSIGDVDRSNRDRRRKERSSRSRRRKKHAEIGVNDERVSSPVLQPRRSLSPDKEASSTPLSKPVRGANPKARGRPPPQIRRGEVEASEDDRSPPRRLRRNHDREPAGSEDSPYPTRSRHKGNSDRVRRHRRQNSSD